MHRSLTSRLRGIWDAQSLNENMWCSQASWYSRSLLEELSTTWSDIWKIKDKKDHNNYDQQQAQKPSPSVVFVPLAKAIYVFVKAALMQENVFLKQQFHLSRPHLTTFCTYYKGTTEEDEGTGAGLTLLEVWVGGFQRCRSMNVQLKPDIYIHWINRITFFVILPEGSQAPKILCLLPY